MLLFFLVYIIICLYGIRFCTQGNENYLSIDTTTSIKGIFILLVFFSHFNSYVSLTSQTNLIYRSIVGLFGQAMVTLFLFYSGYGVMESIKKKGIDYIDSFPCKRILATLFRFDCAVLLFLIVGVIFGSQYSLEQIILSLLGWETLGNSNWYIFVILVLYFITYLAFKLIKTKNYIVQVIVITVITCVLIVICRRYNIKPMHWYDTALCYTVGMFYSLLRKYIDSVFRKNIMWFVLLIALAGTFIVFKSHGSTAAYLLSNIVFALIVVCFTMRFHIGNRILNWCGDNLFELYILQRIPMIVFKNLGVDQINIYFYFILCLVCTVLLIKLFKYITSSLWKLLPLK